MTASGVAPSSEVPAQGAAAAAHAADGADHMMFDELLESMMLGNDVRLDLGTDLGGLDTRTSLETTSLAATECGWLPTATVRCTIDAGSMLPACMFPAPAHLPVHQPSYYHAFGALKLRIYVCGAQEAPACR